MSARKRELPPIRDVAEDLRDGATLDDLCERYDVAYATLANRLSYAGYSTTGHPLRKESHPGPLLVGSQGNAVTGYGGGDYLGLPTVPVLHTRRRRVWVGLDWSTSPASGPQWVEL